MLKGGGSFEEGEAKKSIKLEQEDGRYQVKFVWDEAVKVEDHLFKLLALELSKDVF